MISTIKSISLLIISSFILCFAAFLNGFPFVYFDTGTYLKSSISLEIPVDRPIFYSLFLKFASALPLAKWSAIILQSMIISFLLVVTAKVVLGSKRLSVKLITILFLTFLGSSLPWHTGQLMPDIFTSCLGLSIFLLIFNWSYLRKIEAFFVVFIFVFSVLVHHSHVIIAGSILFALYIGSFLITSWDKAKIRLRTKLMGLLLIISALITPLTNKFISGEAYFSKGAHIFLLARLVEQGLVFNLLNEYCETKKYILCPYKNELNGMSASNFIWSDQSPIEKIGGWTSSSTDSWIIIKDAIFTYPIKFCLKNIKDTFQQILHFNTGDFLISYDDSKTVTKVINENFQKISDDYKNSLQQKSILIQALDYIRPIHNILFWLSIMFSTYTIFLRKRGFDYYNEKLKIFFLFIVLFLTLNAFVCASFATVEERYQSRVSWIIIFFTFTLIIDLIEKKQISQETSSKLARHE